MNKTLCLISVLGWVAAMNLNAAEQDAAPAAPDRAALEKGFVTTMTQATFVGRWNLTNGDQLGESREERYTIQGVSKVGGEVWLVRARMQFGDKDVTVPVPVKVLWAGDTPVITLTDLAIPGVGTFTARVVVHEGRYAGTWSGGDHGGVMSGLIVPGTPPTPADKSE